VGVFLWARYSCKWITLNHSHISVRGFALIKVSLVPGRFQALAEAKKTSTGGKFS